MDASVAVDCELSELKTEDKSALCCLLGLDDLPPFCPASDADVCSRVGSVSYCSFSAFYQIFECF